MELNMSEPNAELIEKFYEAFRKGQGQTMAAMYHKDATFEDPAFGVLKGEMIGRMWIMLTSRSKDLVVNYTNTSANQNSGRCSWTADYTFSKTGRLVHNVIEAAFTFKDGKILTHKDDFNFYRWSRQAFGPVGILIGWTPFFHAKVKKTVRETLDSFEPKK
jgi:ketosteroid isomerase-like protein